MAACPREGDELLDRRRRLGDLGIARSAAAHRHDDDVAVTGQESRDVAGHGGLADAFPGPDHGHRRERERLVGRRLEAEVGADVRQPERERAARPEEAAARSEHRLVGEVEDDVRLDGVERLDERHPVVLPAPDLLRPADEDRGDDVVRQRAERLAHHRRVVLPVD